MIDARPGEETMSAAELRYLLDESESASRFGELIRRMGESRDARFKTIHETNPAAWTSILPVPPGGRVLEIGSGLGSVTLALAANFRQVVSLEPVIEHALFTRLRLRQEGVENVQVVCAPLEDIPFFKNSFDLIVMNGGWERLDEGHGAERFARKQQKMLVHLHSLLKPGGTLLIGARNRMGISAIKDSTGHAGGPGAASWLLKGAAWLLRRILHPSDHSARPSPPGHRHHSHTMRGYRQLLVRAGFSGQSFFSPLPANHAPLEIFPLDSSWAFVYFSLKKIATESYHNSLSYFLKSLLTRIGLMRHFSSYFLILAEKEPDAKVKKGDASAGISIPDLIAARIGAARQELNFFLKTHKSVQKHTLQVIRQKESQPVAIAKIINSRQGENNAFSVESNNLIALHKVFAGDPVVGSSIAQVIALEKNGNSLISLESYLDGTSLHSLLVDRMRHHRLPAVLPLFDPAGEWLLHFHSSCRQKNGLLGDFTTFPAIHDYPAVESPLISSVILEMADSSNSSHYDHFLQHGDFSPVNILIEKGSIHIIDWEDLMQGYPPLFDLFCLFSPLIFIRGTGNIAQDLDRYDELFFKVNPLTEYLFEKVMLHCTRLEIAKALVPLYFYDFLWIKYKRFTEKKDARFAILFKMFIEHYIRNYDTFYLNLIR
jgi:uncharacterized protein (TIGR03382 family)